MKPWTTGLLILASSLAGACVEGSVIRFAPLPGATIFEARDDGGVLIGMTNDDDPGQLFIFLDSLDLADGRSLTVSDERVGVGYGPGGFGGTNIDCVGFSGTVQVDWQHPTLSGRLNIVCKFVWDDDFKNRVKGDFEVETEFDTDGRTP